MANEPSWDDLFESQPGSAPTTGARSTGAAGGTTARSESRGTRTGARDEQLVRRHPVSSRRDLREREGVASRAGRKRDSGGGSPPKRRRRWVGVLAGLLSVVLVLGVGGFAAVTLFGEPIRALFAGEEPIDYEGDGTGEVIVTITDGQVGGDVAQTLVDQGVTRTFEAFNALLLADPAIVFQPGSYAMREEMSARAALDTLMDPASKVFTTVVIPEGTTLPGVLERLGEVSSVTGVTREQLDAAAADLAAFGLPAEAPSLEGYLFPATYTFDPGLDAHGLLQRMVTEMFTRLDALSVPVEDRHRVLTLAALTQKEGGSSSDFFKVARVWENRLAQGQRLESDATVSYGSGGTTISTTDEERADASNPYNTYANDGLPVGPISNPGEAAIEATLAPEPGPWLYFVLIDGETGETAFSNTYDEHLANVRIWQQWLRDHPGFDS